MDVKLPELHLCNPAQWTWMNIVAPVPQTEHLQERWPVSLYIQHGVDGLFALCQ